MSLSRSPGPWRVLNRRTPDSIPTSIPPGERRYVRIVKLSYFIGALCILGGFLVPSTRLIEALRTPPGDLGDQLLLGAMLFRVGLVTLGLFIVILGRMPMWKSAIQKERSASDRNSILFWVILGSILVTALGIRLYELDCGIWYDEILTYVLYMDKSLGEIITTYGDQNNHLLYTLLARLSMLVFGPSVWSLRLPAVFWGVASIWALYLFACQVATKREGLLSAALLTFSYHHVWFSQNARGYTGLLFWTIFSSWLLVRALREERPQLWLWYAISVALGAYTHITMVFVAIGHFVVYLATLFGRSKEKMPNWWIGGVVGFAFAGILTFQLYAFLLPQLLDWQALWQGRVTITPWTNPIWMLLELVKGLNISFSSSIVGIVAFLIFGAGLIDFARKERVVVWLLVVPILVGMTVIMSIGLTLFPRFFFFTIGFGVLILVHGTMLSGGLVAEFLHLDLSKGPLLGTVLCAGLILVSATSVPLAYAPKQDYQGALQFIEEKKEVGDVVVTVGLTVVPYERFYKADWEPVETLEDLNMVRSRKKRTWLLYTLPRHLRSKHPDIMAMIRSDFRVVKQFYGTLGGGTIWVCRADMRPS